MCQTLLKPPADANEHTKYLLRQNVLMRAAMTGIRQKGLSVMLTALMVLSVVAVASVPAAALSGSADSSSVSGSPGGQATVGFTIATQVKRIVSH
jgi:hypothetical protein